MSKTSPLSKESPACSVRRKINLGVGSNSESWKVSTVSPNPEGLHVVELALDGVY